MPSEPSDDASVEFGFGLISCQRMPHDNRSGASLYREALDLAEAAENLGFDSVWVSEHHFFDDSHLPSVLPMAAAIAARTRRAKVGTAVALAPFYHPIRLAEDAATIDLISGGRFILGLGAGWMEQEFRVLNVPIRQRHQRLATAVGVLREAWSDSGANHPSLITPKPAQVGGPPIWLGAGSERAIRRAGTLADGFMANYYIAPETFAEQVRWIREELEPAEERSRSFTFSIQLPIFTWVEGNAWRVIRESVRHVMFKYDQHAEGRRGRAGTVLDAASLSEHSDDELKQRGLFGSPDDVAKGIDAYRRAAGGNMHFIARLYWPGLEYSVQLEAMRVFATEVMPRLGRAGSERGDLAGGRET